MYVFVCWYIYICQSLRTDQEHRHSLCGPERQTLDQTRANTCVCVCALILTQALGASTKQYFWSSQGQETHPVVQTFLHTRTDYLCFLPRLSPSLSSLTLFLYITCRVRPSRLQVDPVTRVKLLPRMGRSIPAMSEPRRWSSGWKKPS